MRAWRPLLIVIALLGLSVAVYAQRGMARGGGNYDVATEATFTGTVDEVRNVPPSGEAAGGLHLILTTASGPLEVHVGPAWFVSSKNVTFAKDDGLTVIGSKVKMGDQEVVIAREIKKGEQVLTLRDAKGVPLWSGRGRGR